MRLKFYALNSVTMDSFDKVLDIIEHPEKYRAREIEEILADPEARELYNLLCKTASASLPERQVDTDAEWDAFAARHISRPRRRILNIFGSRAAAVVAIALSSLAAVALGIAVTVALTGHNAVDAPVAADETVTAPAPAQETSDDTVITADTAPMIFEDATLADIMKAVAENYGVDVMFKGDSASTLHLYYRFDPSLPLDEIVEQLNTFEQINIVHDGNVLFID